MSLESLLPEPGNLWIGYCPRLGREGRGWPGPGRPWLDLAHGQVIGLGDAAGRGDLPAPPGPSPLDDTLYLPPVAPERRKERDALAREHGERGTPLLIQVLPGEPLPEVKEGAEAVVVLDLLATLLVGEDLNDLGRSEPWQRGTRPQAAVWPLVPGLADDAGRAERLCRQLAEAGVPVVQAVRPGLAAGERRRLSELLGGEAFEALFHRPPPAERGFARLAHRHGLQPFLPRPLPGAGFRFRANRQVAAELARGAELCLRLGRGEARAQQLFRASRELDRLPHDLAAIAREGNLGILGFLEEESREMVEEVLATGHSAAVEDLEREYVAGEE